MASDEKKQGKFTDEILEQYEAEGKTVGFAISDIPVSLFREFMYDIHLYGDKYVLKLQDLMRKAEVYDFLMSTGLIPRQETVPEASTDEKEDSGEVVTFSGQRISGGSR